MRRAAATAGFLVVPLAGLLLLLGIPHLDIAWEHQPAHFWLVLISALLSFLLGLLMAEAAGRRGDARVLLVALAFLAASGFLGLHALATPGVLLTGKNAGFQIASAIGLLIASGFAAASALPLGEGWARAILRRAQAPAGLGDRARWSFGPWWHSGPCLRWRSRSPRRPPATRFSASGCSGCFFYGYAAFRYARLFVTRRAPVALAVASAWVLLSEAMLTVAISRNWHVSWWEWHLLMLLAFGIVARSVWSEWKREGSSAEVFADLYEERTLGRREDVSVLFADLQGFTTFSERTPPDEVRAMLDSYFSVATPVIEGEQGEIVQTVGDELFVVFRGDGHEARAARAGLVLQEACNAESGRRPDWPRFRVGVNSGEAHVGLVQARGVRSYTPTGDVVNTGARLQTQARAGEVVIAKRTREALGADARVEDLGELPVKGKEQPVRAYVLRALAARRGEGEDGLQNQDAEGDR